MRRKSLNNFGQKNWKPVSVPLSTEYHSRSNSDQNSSKVTLRNHHQSVWWSLSYDTLRTRPDISLVNSQFKKNICRRRSMKFAILFPYGNSAWYSRTCDTNGLCAYSDTDWAGNVETSRSTTGDAIFPGNSIVSLAVRWWRRSYTFFQQKRNTVVQWLQKPFPY